MCEVARFARREHGAVHLAHIDRRLPATRCLPFAQHPHVPHSLAAHRHEQVAANAKRIRTSGCEHDLAAVVRIAGSELHLVVVGGREPRPEVMMRLFTKHKVPHDQAGVRLPQRFVQVEGLPVRGNAKLQRLLGLMRQQPVDEHAHRLRGVPLAEQLRVPAQIAERRDDRAIRLTANAAVVGVERQQPGKHLAVFVEHGEGAAAFHRHRDNGEPRGNAAAHGDTAVVVVDHVGRCKRQGQLRGRRGRRRRGLCLGGRCRLWLLGLRAIRRAFGFRCGTQDQYHNAKRAKERPSDDRPQQLSATDGCHS